MTSGKQPPKSSPERQPPEKAQQAEKQGKPGPDAKKGRFPKGFQLEPGRTSGIAGYAAPRLDERKPGSGQGGKGPTSKE
jgi:hypothetical protein